ncbi:bifunctional sulfate adenylyltransferase/adenylylsulfate kinase [Coxiella burnetii]|uniref:bifunctional sulfate adenylyltransferase/adenylylsulfate kinase n=1 Tax=Coxiella burnetii TaxID=777 RepID=UPI000183CF95|nr:bifunctional sulfate adenylyltransferase/adenylylsulfate kinase [Coxiella burnetii]ACJ18616.1 sulfate adenylyltransferase [Coxiella burnetii CbuG_Q212]ATN66998.1 adenylyltransferase [Coxiella burnetii]OYK85984.1 adenylyltransferase [Coxiella burnetii]
MGYLFIIINNKGLTKVEKSSQQKNHYKDSLPTMRSLILNPWQLCDLEMLFNGGFAPLNGFLSKADYYCVIETMRLVDGSLWPIPITLDVKSEFATKLIIGEPLALRDDQGSLLGILEVEEIWEPDKYKEAHCVFGTLDEAHPGVKQLLRHKGSFYLNGKLTKINAPKHYDFIQYRLSPQQLKDKLKGLHKNLVGFQTRNPMHRAHFELTRCAAEICNANLLIQPVVGITKLGDMDYVTRARCYEIMLSYYPPGTTFLNFLPLAMRMGGPREALWHMLIRKNYGCTHFIIGRDHASPGVDSRGKPFYEPYAAQALAQKYQTEAGIQIVPFHEIVYSQAKQKYIPVNQIQQNETTLKISGTEIRRRLREGLEIPEWFSYPEVIAELRKSFPPKNKQGITLFLTGLSGAGKSTISKALIAKLQEMDERKITLLDGDVVRKNLSHGLGFSREDRDANVARIAFVASEVTKHGGMAICAQIAPYADTRKRAREIVESQGIFIEVYISAPLEICEQRDPKGLYGKARMGIIKIFTGISDPYEPPASPEIIIETNQITIEESVAKIIFYLLEKGYLTPKVDRVRNSVLSVNA